MRNLVIAATVAAAASIATPVNAFTLSGVGGLKHVSEDIAIVDNAQVFVYLGRPYCFYLDGWHGPGWYRCGYSWRRGHGWGGVYGWNNWNHPRYHARFHRRDFRHDRHDANREVRQERRHDARDARRVDRSDFRRELQQDRPQVRQQMQFRQERQVNRMGGGEMPGSSVGGRAGNAPDVGLGRAGNPAAVGGGGGGGNPAAAGGGGGLGGIGGGDRGGGGRS
jgi:hypothetical protein